MSSTFDADLARANLMRLRADYRAAEELCVNILKSFPKSAATHTLLGDIYSDQGLLEQAAQWYELSLDLDPSSWADKQKLEDVRQQIQERDHISSAAQLGLPDTKAVRSIWVGTGAICMFFLAVALGFAVRFGSSNNHEQPVVKTPVQATPDTTPVHPENTYVAATPAVAPLIPAAPDETGAGPSGAPVTATSEKDLETNVAETSKYGQHLIGLVEDPRNKVTIMTYLVGPKDDERAIGADLAKTLFDISEDPDFITIRAMRNEKLVYMADVDRQRYEETLTDEWQKDHPGPDAWIEYILTNEWPAKSASPAPATTEAVNKGEVDPRSASPASSPSSGSSGN